MALQPLPPSPKRTVATPIRSAQAPIHHQRTPASQPQPSPALNHEDGDDKDDIPKYWYVIGALLVIGSIWGGWHWVIEKPKQEWKANFAVDFSISRTFPGAAILPNLDEQFTMEAKNLIVRKGQGIRVKWNKTNGKKNSNGEKVFLEPKKGTNFPLREEELRIAREKLAAFLDSFNAPPEPKNRVIVVAVDDTAGMDNKLAQQVQFNFDNLDIDEMTRAGDSIRLLFQKITSTDFFEGKLVKLAAKEKLDADVTQKHLGGWLLRHRGPEKESSIATGLLNIAAEARINEDSHILIFSDGLENLPGTTASFEVGKFSNPDELANEANWDELDKALTGPIRELKGSTPSLKGARVDWYAPPTEESGRAKRIRAAMKYWRHFLDHVHAGEVEMHF